MNASFLLIFSSMPFCNQQNILCCFNHSHIKTFILTGNIVPSPLIFVHRFICEQQRVLNSFWSLNMKTQTKIKSPNQQSSPLNTNRSLLIVGSAATIIPWWWFASPAPPVWGLLSYLAFPEKKKIFFQEIPRNKQDLNILFC